VRCSSALEVCTERLDFRQYGSSDALLTADGTIVGHAEYEAARLDTMPLSSSELSSDSMPEAVQAHTDRRGFDADKRCVSLSAALSVIKRDLGLEAAHQIAERLLHDLSRKLLSSPLLRDNGTPLVRDKIHVSARWIEANYDQAISMVDAAQLAAMSERNYLRRFRDVMGITPSDYLLQLRLDRVCRLLIGTDLPVEKIARRSGMGNGSRLGNIFRKRLSMSPTEYRQRHNYKMLESVQKLGRHPRRADQASGHGASFA